MLRKLRERSGSDSGFTLVELLVVMLILGILAAIAIPAFFSQRDKARDADAKADTRAAQTAAETYATDQPNGNYVGMDATDLVGIEETLSDAVALTATPIEANEGYTVSSDSLTGTTFSLTRHADGSVDRACDAPGDGGCQDAGGTGTW